MSEKSIEARLAFLEGKIENMPARYDYIIPLLIVFVSLCGVFSSILLYSIEVNRESFNDQLKSARQELESVQAEMIEAIEAEAASRSNEFETIRERLEQADQQIEDAMTSP